MADDPLRLYGVPTVDDLDRLLGRTGRDRVRTAAAVASALRLVPDPAVRACYILELGARGLSGWFWAAELIRRSIDSRQQLIELLEHALEHGNPTTMGYWLRVIVPKLGCDRGVRLVADRIDTMPTKVEMATYHLKAVVRRKHGRAFQRLEELESELERRGLVKHPVRVPDPDHPGQFLYRPIDFDEE